MAAKSVARLMRSSMGPKGMDKMMQSPDGDILISERCRVTGDAARLAWPLLCELALHPSMQSTGSDAAATCTRSERRSHHP
jgi:chaperonin GroEL (HSP60 family)